MTTYIFIPYKRENSATGATLIRNPASYQQIVKKRLISNDYGYSGNTNVQLSLRKILTSGNWIAKLMYFLLKPKQLVVMKGIKTNTLVICVGLPGIEIDQAEWTENGKIIFFSRHS